MFTTILRLLLTGASTYGYMRFFSRRLAPALTPGFTFASLGSAMLLAGLLNILPETALLLGLGGLVCLALSVKERRKLTLSLGSAFFIAALAALTARLWGEKLLFIDNFTHWGTVVRHLLATNRFPSFQDPYIRFPSYPLGASGLIYYFAYLTGIRAEGFQMLIHWACAAAMLSGLFCLAKTLPARLACFIGSALLLCGDNNFNQLMVDTLIACVALGAAAFCVACREELHKKALWVIPWLTFLITVKSSGALFVLFIVLLVFVWGGWRKGLVCAAAPLAALLLWNRHVSYAFEQGMQTQHALSIEHFKQMLSLKREGTAQAVASKLLHEVFSLNNPYLAVFLLSVALFIVSLIFAKKAHLIRGLLIFGVACYAVYQAGMLGMYLFTMQEKEALRLASYDRYHGTILIFCAGMALTAALLAADRLKEKRVWANVCCAVCAVALAVSGIPHYTHYTRAMDADTLAAKAMRDRTDGLIAQYALPEGASYYILVDDDFSASDVAYLYNMANGLLLAKDIQVRKLDKLFSADEVKKYDYLVGYGDSDAIADFIREGYGSDARAVPTAVEEKAGTSTPSSGSRSRGAKGRRG